MRALQLGPYPPPHGGIQTNLVAIRRFLLKRNIPCAVINLTRFRRPEADGVYYPRNAPHVLWLLLRLRYDVVHLHVGGDLTLRLLFLGLVCCLIPRAKAVLTFHSGGYPSSPAGSAAHDRTLLGFVLRRFDRIIAVNGEILKFLHKVGVAPRRARLICPHSYPSGTTQKDGPLPKYLSDFLASHSPVLITVGLLEPEYDLPLQVEAIGLLRSAFPNAGLIIVGSGSLEEDLRRSIRMKPYGPHVLLCGDLPHDTVLRTISKSDLMLRTTLYDGDSVSVREALHCGIPVIATDNGMRPEGVRLIPVGDISALRGTIEEALETSVPARPIEITSDEQNLEAVLNIYQEAMRE